MEHRFLRAELHTDKTHMDIDVSSDFISSTAIQNNHVGHS